MTGLSFPVSKKLQGMIEHQNNMNMETAMPMALETLKVSYKPALP